MEEERAAINAGAVYIGIGKVLIDCRDIESMNLLGYAPKEGTQEVDPAKPVYRIVFTNGDVRDSIVEKEAYDKYMLYKEAD